MNGVGRAGGATVLDYTKTKEFVMMNILVSLIRFNARICDIYVTDPINES
jgi:hypothetical protein